MVRLKVKAEWMDAEMLLEFQFLMVRLKVQKKLLQLDKLANFNSLWCD